MFFHGAYSDFLLRDLKFKPMPKVLHQKTCPKCGRKLVNLYQIKDGSYYCKKCVDELAGEGSGK